MNVSGSHRSNNLCGKTNKVVTYNLVGGYEWMKTIRRTEKMINEEVKK